MNTSSTHLNSPVVPSSRSAILRWLPFILLAASAVLLALNWERVPERWVTHWNARGEPDGWATKTPAQVFIPHMLGAGICAFLEILASIISKIRKPGRGYSASVEATAAIARATADFVRLINVVVAIIFSYLAISLPLHPTGNPKSFVAVVLALIGLAIVIGIYRMKRAHDDLRRAGKLEGLEGWNGLIYSNPKDPRLWVPKIIGPGYTFNFAHPLAWPLFILIISIPLATILLIFLFAK